MAHDHHGAGSGAGRGHNHGRADHLTSHLGHDDDAEALSVLAAQFLDGFRQAADKTAYLRLMGVPFEIADDGGGASLKLVDVTMTTAWQVGTASPGFCTQELHYLPFPGNLVHERTNVAFVYVSLTRRVDVDLRSFLSGHAASQAR